jgi:hypothetical protein
MSLQQQGGDRSNWNSYSREPTPSTSSQGWNVMTTDDGQLDLAELGTAMTAQRIPLPLLAAVEDRIASAADTNDYPLDTALPDW